MLFRRREAESWLERVRVHLWPRRSFSRSGRYVVYRLRRLSESPARGCARLRRRRLLREHALSRHSHGHGGLDCLDGRRQHRRRRPRDFPRQSADLSAAMVLDLPDRQSHARRAGAKHHIDLSNGIFQSSLAKLWPILKPMSLGCIPVGLAIAALSYVLVKPMVEAYRHRRLRELELRSREALGAP